MELLGGRLLVSEPAPWVLGSLALAILVANLSWLIARRRWHGQGKPGGGLLTLVWLAVSLYLLLPPLAAWRLGALSPFFLGLAEINWLESLSAGGLLAGLIVALPLYGWLLYRRSSPDLTGLSRPVRSITAWCVPVDAALRQWHWAFYRAAAIGWLAGWAATAPGAEAPLRGIEFAAAPLQWVSLQMWPLLRAVADQPLYWGSWLGLGLIAVEAALNPFTAFRASSYARTELALLRVTLAVATTALFVLSRNLWLCLACQVVVETIIGADLRSLADATKDE
ncbi:MAG: hypothetical protein NT169_12590 [Chloroflexi bacterium]|nr:hypothetical protein [Chloroflexota bacterium]